MGLNSKYKIEKRSKKLLSDLNCSEVSVCCNGNLTSPFFVNNTIFLPLWNYSEDLLGLCVYHELAHALFSPLKLEKNTSEINVLEDVRVERLLKNQFSCVSDIMLRGYHELHARMYFDQDPRLISRINRHYKIGHIVKEKFSKKELLILKRINNMTTINDVYEVSNEIV